MTAGAAAAGLALAALRPGRELPIEPAVAAVDPGRCSGCRACLGVCPYRAIEVGPGQRVAVVNPTICLGCGACVAACPAAAVVGHHFTDAQLFAEIEGALA